MAQLHSETVFHLAFLSELMANTISLQAVSEKMFQIHDGMQWSDLLQITFSISLQMSWDSAGNQNSVDECENLAAAQFIPNFANKGWSCVQIVIAELSFYLDGQEIDGADQHPTTWSLYECFGFYQYHYANHLTYNKKSQQYREKLAHC